MILLEEKQRFVSKNKTETYFTAKTKRRTIEVRLIDGHWILIIPVFHGIFQIRINIDALFKFAQSIKK